MTPVWDVLVFAVLPLWVLAGFADYWCHRTTFIERATGAQESILHWLMLGEVALPILAVLFFQVNALVLAFMIPCLIAHEITGWFDLKLAMATRNVTAFEQQVHSVLEMMPLTAMLLMYILHWPQALAIFGAGSQAAEWRLVWQPSPWGALAPPFLAFGLLAILPYAEEFLRGLRAQARGRVKGVYKTKPEMR
jgi:hypothetical protein